MPAKPAPLENPAGPVFCALAPKNSRISHRTLTEVSQGFATISADLKGITPASEVSMLKPANRSQETVHEQVGMKRWLRLTARKTTSTPKAVAKSGNPAADAAADALAALLKDARKMA
jgi:hypothetical protein